MLATPVTLKPLFEKDEGMATLGGPAYLAQLTGSGAGLIGARQFARQIYDLALLRELVTVGRNMVDKALDTSEDVNPREQIDKAEEALFKVAGRWRHRQHGQDVQRGDQDCAGERQEGAERGRRRRGRHYRLRFGQRPDRRLHHSDLIILAGRPGMGKTSLVTNIAYNAARRLMDDIRLGIAPKQSIGAKVAFFSLEMSADQLALRILSEQSRIASEALRMGNISKAEFAQLAAAAADLEQLPLYIDDTAGLTISALHSRVRRLQSKHNGELGMVIVDYLQLLQGSATTAKAIACRRSPRSAAASRRWAKDSTCR
jgi:replicative DNA helicase